MPNKRRIQVAIYHRGALSLSDNRSILGPAAFHWGFIITPKHPHNLDCQAYDVSDGVSLDPVSGEDLNPDRNWLFRSKSNVDIFHHDRLIGRILIGKVPSWVPRERLERILKEVKMPVRGVEPAQNCVSWTMDAIQALQDKGVLGRFDRGVFLERALAFADSCLVDLKPGCFWDYTAALASSST
ncbi:hypothetical protein PHISCL_04176 [Aspergillus sclerotialis]|uniref:Uncharacterized protein n=1 Tax=Aspergillus sclerotialis TaxID=2070753 RepID=A0A3A2ZPW8_9EURO|nr:hypothetical protein PHISCL_04176 [Aspergillus sclerotialis]